MSVGTEELEYSVLIDVCLKIINFVSRIHLF